MKKLGIGEIFIDEGLGDHNLSHDESDIDHFVTKDICFINF